MNKTVLDTQTFANLIIPFATMRCLLSEMFSYSKIYLNFGQKSQAEINETFILTDSLQMAE